MKPCRTKLRHANVMFFVGEVKEKNAIIERINNNNNSNNNNNNDNRNNYSQ